MSSKLFTSRTSDEFLIKSDDEILPWSWNQLDVEVALTGSALRLVIENKDRDPFTFFSVLSKVQVYARMSPTDKENLIESL